MDKIQVIQQKILTLPELKRLQAGWKLMDQKTVFTNGCFDILHRGHVSLLAQAAEKGQKLVVGLNTDASVKRLKGPHRPVVQEQDRAFMLACLFFVDAVILFDEDTPEQLIRALLPDVLVKGGDYTPETVAGASTITEHGGEVIIIPLVNGYSTTGIIQRMKEE